MDRFKLISGMHESFPITQAKYLEKTGKESPYCKDESSYYAVCPECDNPIEIIDLFENATEPGRKPYGRHHSGDVVQLAEYNEEDYHSCAYSNPKWEKPKALRSLTSSIAPKILVLMREQFDRAIYLLEKEMELYIGLIAARKMLSHYLEAEAWRYRVATLNNLPWILAESNKATPLFGKYILADGELHKAIAKNCPDADFKAVDRKYVQITSKNKSFLDLKYILYKHRKEVVGEHLQESITFWVYSGTRENSHDVYTKEIDILTNFFMSLVSMPDEAKRNQGLLDIAKKLIPDA